MDEDASNDKVGIAEEKVFGTHNVSYSMVDGKEVTPGEMHAKMKAASATSDASKKSFDDTKNRNRRK